mmetsp:Transcript_12720/g.19716  ORF Transcript_12720/g.19716 Transcript_12720/m.19716 type:complete len:454 (-) Transcript_12720:165-1526(-)
MSETDKLVPKKSRFDDGYEYPDLYYEADHMLEAAEVIYTLAAMRDLAWKNLELEKAGKPILAGDLTDEEFLVPEVDPKTGYFVNPIDIPELAQFTNDNIKNLKQDTEFWASYGGTIELLKDLVPEKGGRSSSDLSLRSRSIMYIDDAYGDEAEILYAISLDDNCKRVIVNFRGTTTVQDLKVDAQITLVEFKLPNVEKKVKLHRGFYDYLFDKEFSAEDKSQHEDLNKYEEIMTKVKPLFKQYPSYKLYVTGHSLGASLSSLFAFVASQDPDSAIPKPVTCVSVASTYVGNQAWREVFQSAEEAGEIRYLRVSNRTDVIPHGPPFDLIGNLYKHVGVNLLLSQETIFKSKPSYSFHFPTGSVLTEWYTAFCNNFVTNCAWIPSKILVMHGCPEYDRRLDSLKSTLKGVYLNDLYEDYFIAKKEAEAKWVWNTFLKYAIPGAVLAGAIYMLDVL